jgi:hypothetical protein
LIAALEMIPEPIPLTPSEIKQRRREMRQDYAAMEKMYREEGLEPPKPAPSH